MITGVHTSMPYLSRSADPQIASVEFDIDIITLRTGKIDHDDNFVDGFKNIHRGTPRSLVEYRTWTIEIENIIRCSSKLFSHSPFLNMIMNFDTTHFRPLKIKMEEPKTKT